MSQEGFKRKLTAIFSADVVGYSRLMGDDEAATVNTLEAYQEIMTTLIQQHRGRVIDSPGDNLLAEFASVVDAVQCGVAVQKELQARNEALPENRRMELRIGINLGDVIQEGDRIYGDGVNVAARLEALSDPGGICISKPAFDHIESKLPLGYEFLGDQTVKNIAKPIGAYRVLMEPRVVIAGAKKKPSAPLWRRKSFISSAIAALVVIMGVAVWSLYLRPPPIEPASLENMAFPLPDKPSIAVLPFTNMGGDSEQEYFCEGMTDQIITSLSMIPRLFVIARNSTFVYKGKAIKVQKVAEELGVRYVLEGSVQKSKKRIRILVQLIDATTGRHLWSERYDRDLKDLFTLQDEISKKIMTNLQVELTEGEYARLVSGGTSNLKAVECFWRGSKHFFRFSKEDNALARQWGEKAIELDPNFADAWALMGWSHVIDSSYSWSKSPTQSLKQAEECAQRAITLNNSNAKAYSLLGRIRSNQRKYDEAIEYGEKSVALNPNDPVMISTLAVTMHFIGRFDDSIALIKKAMRLSPYYPAIYLRLLSRSYLLTGRYEEAQATSKLLLDRSLKGEFNPLFAHLQLAEASIGLGREDEARAHAEEVLKIDPNFSLNGFRILSYYRDPVYSQHRIAALRKAGLPEKPPLPMPDKPSIAVLPFTNMSDDPKQEYFVDGMTDDIITDLSKISGLFIIARNSVFTYKGKSVNVRDIGRELGVRYVLEGSVRRAVNEVRINAQLIDATTGGHLWAERYDGKLGDIFALQDIITKKIVSALALKLTGNEEKQIAQKKPNSPEAHDAFLKGWALYLTPGANYLALSVKYFMKAIEIDPTYTHAYAALASTFWKIAQSGWDPYLSLLIREARVQAKEYLQKAMKTPTSLAFRVGSEIERVEGRYQKAIAEANRAISSDSNNPDGYAAMAMALIKEGSLKKGAEYIKRAMRLNPHCPPSYLMALGEAQFGLEQFEEAAVSLEKASSQEPDNKWAFLLLAVTYERLGREQEINSTIEKYNKLRIKSEWDRPSSLHGIDNWLFNVKTKHELLNVCLKQARTNVLLEHDLIIAVEDLISRKGKTDFIWDATAAYTAQQESHFEVEGATTIDVTTAKALYDRGVTFVDVGNDSSWNFGYIPGSRHLVFNRDFRKAELSKIVNNKDEVVIYLWWPNIRGAVASAMAVYWGFEKVYHYPGGVRDWQRAGYPFVRP